ncbi:hypothetical protein [Streptomyces sp. NPDC002644]
MNALTLNLTDQQLRELAERADAEGSEPERFAGEAVLAVLEERAAEVREVGAAYAAAHAELLRRLGE